MTIISSPRRSLRTGFEPRSGTRVKIRVFARSTLSFADKDPLSWLRWRGMLKEVVNSINVDMNAASK